MIYLLAVLLPSIALLIRGHIWQAILCFILHLTLIGWIPAAIWACFVIQNDDNERRYREMRNRW
jgi:uncharacterized membrane protein YqaE (UPF0057 family)